jgi:N-formylglutamate amidohydrolase
MKKIVLHIPHSSIYIPEEYKNQYFGGIEETLSKLTDTFTDDLFDIDACKKFIFPYSRIFCDVERLKVNEMMDKFGQGIIYTNDVNLNPFRNITEETKKEIISRFYELHHQSISDYIDDTCPDLILDCHSFSNEIYPCTPFQEMNVCNLPDICVGYNGDEKSKRYVDMIFEYFLRLGYNITVNSPYSGSFSIGNIPSVMIEINKKLYLRDNFKDKNSDYYKLKAAIKFIINKVRACPANRIRFKPRVFGRNVK